MNRSIAATSVLLLSIFIKMKNKLLPMCFNHLRDNHRLWLTIRFNKDGGKSHFSTLLLAMKCAWTALQWSFYQCFVCLWTDYLGVMKIALWPTSAACSLSDNYTNYRAAVKLDREVNSMLFLTLLFHFKKTWVKRIDGLWRDDSYVETQL